MRPGARWIVAVVGLLVLSLLTHGVLIAAAVFDPGFSILPGYEQQAANWDAVAAERRASADLGWIARLTTRAETHGVRLAVDLRDRSGAPVPDASVTVETFFNARASRVVTATLTEPTPGHYTAVLPIRRSGLWEFNLQATRPGERFVDRRRLHVVVPARRSRQP